MRSFGVTDAFFDRISINAKALAAPIVLISCILIISATSIFTLQDAAARIGRISGTIVTQQQQILAVKQGVVDIEIEVQRYAAWASNQVSPKLMAGLVRKIESNKSKVERAIANPAVGPSLSLRSEWRVYAQRVEDLIQVGTTDGAMAVMMLSETDDAFSKLSRTLAARSESASQALIHATGSLKGRANADRKMMIFQAFLGLALSGIICWFAVRSFARPIISITAAMRKLAAGDYAAVIGDQNRGDEVGEMARAIEVFRVAALRAKDLETGARELDRRRSEERAAEISQIAKQFRSSIADIVRRVTTLTIGLRDKAAIVSDCSRATVEETQSTRAAIEDAQTNIVRVADAAGGLKLTVQELVRQTSNVKQLSCQTAQQTTTTKEEIRNLSSCVDQISSVASFIQVVAQQTNLLALNATIEAARAGASGKGFAVVAAEVKSLSLQVESAAIEIAERISAVQASRDNVSKSTDEVMAAIQDLEACSAMMAAAVDGQAGATSQISQSAECAARHASAASARSHSLDAKADQADRLSAHLLQEAQLLFEETGSLAGKTDDFLHYLANA